MKFIDKYALLPIERYNQLIKRSNPDRGEDNTIDQQGLGQEPFTDTSEGAGKNNITNSTETTNTKQKQYIGNKDVTNSTDSVLRGEEPLSNNTDQKQHITNKTIPTKGAQKPHKVKPSKKINKTHKIPPPPPGIPNTQSKNYIRWEKLF